jgi:hypothetical protein
MTPQTDIRFQIGFATVQLQPAEMTEADLKAPAAEFVRMQHANDRAREGKLYAHHAHAIYEREGEQAMQGLMQSALFDVDKSDGRKELRELVDAVKEMVVEKMYEGRVIV